MKTLLILSLAFVANASHALEHDAAVVDPLSTGALLRVFGSLGVIIVAIFGLVWLLRRSGNLVRGKDSKLKVVDVLSLGQRERLVLVAVGDQQVLLGVSPGRVQAVHTLDTPHVEAVAEPPAGRFADALRRASAGQAASAAEGNTRA